MRSPFWYPNAAEQPDPNKAEAHFRTQMTIFGWVPAWQVLMIGMCVHTIKAAGWDGGVVTLFALACCAGFLVMGLRARYLLRRFGTVMR